MQYTVHCTCNVGIQNPTHITATFDFRTLIQPHFTVHIQHIQNQLILLTRKCKHCLTHGSSLQTCTLICSSNAALPCSCLWEPSKTAAMSKLELTYKPTICRSGHGSPYIPPKRYNHSTMPVAMMIAIIFSSRLGRKHSCNTAIHVGR